MKSRAKPVEEPKRLRSLEFPDALWTEIRRTALDESERTGTYVSASDVIRDGATREVRRLRRRLDK